LDNGPEFAEAKLLETSVGLDVYRTAPHSPWQRGSIEHFSRERCRRLTILTIAEKDD